MDTFPLDWDQWRKLWTEWLVVNEPKMKRVAKAFPGKNFLANEILGTWIVGGKLFELSEVVFPNLEDRDPQTGRLLEGDKRRIGVTFREGDGKDIVVGSFEDLERVIGL